MLVSGVGQGSGHCEDNAHQPEPSTMRHVYQENTYYQAYGRPRGPWVSYYLTT
jgi:hypothetical protein